MTGILTSSYFSNCVQNSAFQVISEGSLKAVGRPLFTLADTKATPEQKKYSALKELSFQVSSMILYFLAVTTLVKGGSYKLLRKMPKFKDMECCKENKRFKDFCKNFEQNQNTKPVTNIKALNKKNYELTKGAMEFITMIGSGIILTILCPLIVSKKIVHPIMQKYDQLVASKKKKSQS